MIALLLVLLLRAEGAEAKTIVTNEVVIADAPDWLTESRTQKVVDHIQMHLEWSIRKMKVYWHTDEAEYEKTQSYGPLCVAVTKIDSGAAVIHIGPTVDKTNFDEVFGHELVHVIAFQKYKGAIPKWLEEGLANHFSRAEKVDYKWLAKQPFPDDVHDLAHPFAGSLQDVTYRYKASQAFAEMLAKKCDLEELIRLSVTKKMEDYMRSYCEIKDLNVAFRQWVSERAR